MSVTVAEFIAPRGRIDTGLLFPGESNPVVYARFNAYIAAGVDAAAKLVGPTPEQRDEIVRAYVYYRAYDAVVDRMSNTPSTFTAADEGSVTFSGAQLNAMIRKRDEALSDYNGLVAPFGVIVEARGQERPSTVIPRRFLF